MSIPPLSKWDHSLFLELRILLERVMTQPTTSLLRKLNVKLEEAQPWLLSLTALPAPSPEDQLLIEKSPIVTASGATVPIVDELLVHTRTISTTLNISQLLSAVLALQAIAERPRFASRSIPEIAVYIYHEFLQQALSFLEEILRLTVLPEAESGPVVETLRDWVDIFLQTRTSLGKGRNDGTLVDQIIQQLDDVQFRINTLIRSTPANGNEVELLTWRITALRLEQNKMAGILGLLAEGGYLRKGFVVKVLKWLKKCDRLDGMVLLVLSAIYAATRPLDQLDGNDARFDAIESSYRDPRYLALASRLIVSCLLQTLLTVQLEDQWVIPQLREAVKLHWCLFFLSALKHDPNVNQIGLDSHQMEHHILEAISGEAFQFLTQMVTNIRRERGFEDSSEGNQAGEDPLTRLATKSDSTFDGFIFNQLQDLVDSYAGRKQFLRNLKNKEEDVAVRRSQTTPPPANFQAFLSLVAAVYKCLPSDSAQHLWDDPVFTGAVLDSRGGYPGPAFWEMASAISTGPVCAAKAYEKMKETRLQWTGLFKFYQHFHGIMPHLFEPIKSNRTPSFDPMPAEEVDICKGWTKFLATVVRWSDVARGALLQAKPHPLQTLFDFLNCDIPFDLKAVVLDAITAFCTRTGDSLDDDVISKAVDFYERITFADPSLEIRYSDGPRIPAPLGWIAKMEYAEQDSNTYALTRAYIRFLTSLLPTPSKSDSATAARPRLANALRRATFYIFDRILLVPNARRYSSERERWEMFDSVFAFLEKALLGFNMGELLVQESSRAIGQVASGLAEEPGFLVLLRLLSEPDILAPLAEVIDQAGASIETRPSHVNEALLRVLRIYYRVLDIQVVYADVLLVTLSDPSRNPTHPFRRPLSFQSLDHHLLHRTSNVTAIALCVGGEDPSISFISTKIISLLSQSPIFNRSDIFRGEHTTSVNRLAGILETSDDSIRIAQSFFSKLEGEGEDITLEESVKIEETVLRGDISPSSIEALPLVIRSTILDLLIDGTAPDSRGPNVAHFLLGFDFRSNEFGLQDPRSENSRLSCLHVVMRQLAEGTDVNESSGINLIYIHPTIAAKSAQLIYQLFSHSFTARAAMNYAVSTEGFSPRQLASLPRECPPATNETASGIGVVSTFTSEVTTSAEILVAYLEFQRWILSAVALETFSFEGNGPSASQVARSFFGGGVDEEDENEDVPQGQRPPLVIDLLSCIDAQWLEIVSDTESPNKVLEFYSGFAFDQFKRPDVDWWDLEGLDRSLQASRRQLEKQGAISTGPSSEAMVAEAAYVIKRLASKNRETDISLAKGNFLTAWNETLKVSLVMLFKHVSEERQEVLLFELLDSLLDRLDGQLAPGVVQIICESTLVTITTLVNILSEFDGVNLPVDRLSGILVKIIEAVTKPGSTENARGNLYASISQHLQLLTPTSSSFDDNASVVASTAGAGAGYASNGLQRTTLHVLSSKKDRFLSVLARDAMDDRDVWKTECFALLGAIVSICQSEKDRSILSPLTQNGFLPLFVRSIKDRELALSECFSSEPENLHAYWVYEAKVAFLIALASSRKGAEELLEAGIFEMLSMCGFVDVQPITDGSMDGSMNTEAVLRQHRTLILALQLLLRVLSSLHKTNRSAAGYAISFINAHRESLLMLLRENQQYITVTGIEESRLLISILALVTHKVPADDLRSPSGFGAFHLAILSLAARFFDRDSWTDNLDRQDDVEPVESQVLGLNQIILVYLCGTTSELKSGSGYPAFVTGSQRGNGATTKYIASAPSLQMAVNLLSDLAESVVELSTEFEDISEKLQSGGELDDGDVEKLRASDINLDSPLSVEGIVEAYANRSHIMLNMIESLLLLIWRHLLFYANDARGSLDPVKPDNLSLSLGAFSSQIDKSRMSNSVDTVRILEKIATALKGTLERIDDIDLHPDFRLSGKFVGGIREGDVWFGMLVRRLGELCAGLIGGSMDED